MCSLQTETCALVNGPGVCVSDEAHAGAAGGVRVGSDGSSGPEAALPAAAAALQQRAGAAEEDLPETERQTAHRTQPAPGTTPVQPFISH